LNAIPFASVGTFARNVSLGTTIAALGLSAAASGAETAYSQSPIAITACAGSAATLSNLRQPYFQLDVTQSTLDVNFTNNGTAPAIEVTFLVSDGRSGRRIDDRGSFSPGVPIAHRLLSPYWSDTSALTCTVAAVHFADGTAWQSPTANVASR
jgi:hypothetical protein